MRKIIKKLKYVSENYLVESIVLIIIGVILINTLFVYPIVGKADNGDFGRLFLYGGLEDLGKNYESKFDGYVHLKYLLNNPGVLLPFGPNWTFGSVILKISMVIQLFSSGFKGLLFDMRYQTFVYCLLLLTSIFLILRFKALNTRLKVIAGLFFILFFTDVNYIAYLSSFFGEATTFVFFFLNIGTFLFLINKAIPKLIDFTFFFLASAGFLTSKTQQIPLLLFMLIIYGSLYFYYREKNYRKHIIKCSVAVVILCICTYLAIGSFSNKNNMYQAVFTGILKGSDNPEKDLKELGINPKFSVLAGTGFYYGKFPYDPMGEEMTKEFYPLSSQGKVLKYYIKNPDRLWEKLDMSAQYAYVFYDVSEHNFLMNQYSEEKKVNEFRTNLTKDFPWQHHNIYIYIIFSTLFFSVMLLYFFMRKDRITRLTVVMLLFILASGASQLVLPIIGSGEADLGKHLFLLNLGYDAMLGIAVLWVFHMIENIWNNLLLSISSLLRKTEILEN